MYNHNTFNIVDESNVIPSEPSVPKRLSYIIPIFSSKGDRNFNEIARLTQARQMYGSDFDNFEKYGQAGMNLVAGLNGGATIFACRLLPDNAKRAAIAFSIQTKAQSGIPQYERTATGGFELDADGNKIPLLDVEGNPVVSDGIAIKLVSELVEDPDNFNSGSSTVADGWTNYPIDLFTYYTDGKCGNNVGFSFAVDKNRDRKVTDGRRYSITLYERTQEGDVSKMDEETYFSFMPDAKDPSNTAVREFITTVYPSVFSNNEKNPIKLTHFNENFMTVISSLQEFIPGVALADIDPIFGKNKAGYAYDRVVIDPLSLDVEDTKVFLKGGTDGSLELGATIQNENGEDVAVTSEMIAATKKKLLIDFWNCDYNDEVLDKRLVPAGFAFDCIDYDNDIKASMDGIHQWRDDIVVFLAYAAKNESQALQLLSPIKAVVNGEKAWNLVIIPHAGVTTNLIDNKYLLATYEVSRSLPECYGAFGRYSTYAGYKAGKIKYMKFDWTAKLRKNDTMLKLEDEGLMYAQVLDRNGTTAWMNAKNQYNKPFSKMKFWRNAAVIGDAMRSADAILIKYKYDPAGATRAIGEVQKELITFFAEKAYPDSIKVVPNVYQTKNDKMIERASCDITFYFPGEVTGFNVTIYSRREEDLEGGK